MTQRTFNMLLFIAARERCVDPSFDPANAASEWGRVFASYQKGYPEDGYIHDICDNVDEVVRRYGKYTPFPQLVAANVRDENKIWATLHFLRLAVEQFNVDGTKHKEPFFGGMKFVFDKNFPTKRMETFWRESAIYFAHLIAGNITLKIE